jgi:hypothetical protein
MKLIKRIIDEIVFKKFYKDMRMRNVGIGRNKQC